MFESCRRSPIPPFFVVCFIGRVSEVQLLFLSGHSIVWLVRFSEWDYCSGCVVMLVIESVVVVGGGSIQVCCGVGMWETKFGGRGGEELRWSAMVRRKKLWESIKTKQNKKTKNKKQKRHLFQTFQPLFNPICIDLTAIMEARSTKPCCGTTTHGSPNNPTDHKLKKHSDVSTSTTATTMTWASSSTAPTGEKKMHSSGAPSTEQIYQQVQNYYGKVLQTTKDLKTSACLAMDKPHHRILEALKKWVFMRYEQ